MPTLTAPWSRGGVIYAARSGAAPPPASGGSSAYTVTQVPDLLVSRGYTSYGVYEEWVSLLEFDTSGLPDDCEIESATLKCDLRSGSKEATAETYDWGATVDTGDYTARVEGNSAGVARSVRVQGPDGWSYESYEIDLTAAMLAAVSTTGPTRLRLWMMQGWLTVAANRQTVTYDTLELAVTYAEPGQQEGQTPPSGSDPQTDPEDIAYGGGGVSARTVLPQASTRWAIYLCGLDGKAIASLTPIASDRRYSARLNRPARLTFTVPSDHELVAAEHTDGLPRLTTLCRAVKAYRLERLSDGSEQWTLRFAGPVWQIEDSGGPEQASTGVVCFDPLQTLAYRFTGADRSFAGEAGTAIARKLVDEANADAATGLTTEGGVFETSPDRTVGYSYRRVGDALLELASAFNGFDFQVAPLDRQDGTLARLNAYARLGQTQPNVVLGWGIAPHNVRDIRRLEDAAVAANEVLGLGAAGITATSRAAARGIHMEAISSHTDVTNQEFLQALVAEELAFRSGPRELVSITPQPGVSPEPWTHFRLGDSVYVYAGARLRGGFAGLQRIYGFDLDLGDDAVERVGQIIAAPE